VYVNVMIVNVLDRLRNGITYSSTCAVTKLHLCNGLPATADFNSLAAFKTTVQRADLSAFFLCIIVVDVFLLLLCFIPHILVTLAQFCAKLLFFYMW